MTLSIADLHKATLEFEATSIMDFSKIDLLEEVDSLVVNSSKYDGSFKEKTEPNEVFAEYLSQYLTQDDNALALHISEMILNNIFWVLHTFRVTYIISLNDYTYSTKIKSNHITKIIQKAVVLESQLDEELKKEWKELIYSLRNRLVETT